SLRETLTQRGHTFASDHSDTEVLLHGYRAWGRDLPRHLHGMFALAIWDVQAQQLLLCRDRTGKKPLYYSRRRGPHDELIFGSTVATLAAADPGGGLPLDPQALLHYLRIGY